MKWAGFQRDMGGLGLIGWCLSGVRRKGERSAGCLGEEGGIMQKLQQGVWATECCQHHKQQPRQEPRDKIGDLKVEYGP